MRSIALKTISELSPSGRHIEDLFLTSRNKIRIGTWPEGPIVNKSELKCSVIRSDPSTDEYSCASVFANGHEHLAASERKNEEQKKQSKAPSFILSKLDLNLDGLKGSFIGKIAPLETLEDNVIWSL